jgi:thioesterase domain-containing protein
MELTRKLESSQTVFALDDDVITSGKEFLFSSIAEVAEACCNQIVKAMEITCNSVLRLAGWSYGGVIAIEVAKLLLKTSLDVKDIVLFDAPLVSSVVDATIATTEEDGNIQLPVAWINEQFIAQRSVKHFQSCTSLLHQYYQQQREQRQQDQTIFNCPILDIRPSQSDYFVQQKDIEQFSTGVVYRTTVRGSHWTMLSSDHVYDVVTAMQSFYKSA